MRRLAAGAVVGVLAAALSVGLSASGHPLAAARACPVLPRTNPWNQRVDTLRVARDSARLIGSIGASAGLHPDFGSGLYGGGPIGIPYVVVPRTQRRVPVSFDYASESDRGPYPIPPNAPVEGGRNSTGDRHVIVVQRGTCRLWELFDAHPIAGGRRWRAGSGATWSLRSNRLRPRTWTSADAAGLPILPGLARPDDLRAGSIDHALRFTVPRTRRAFIFPARHFASSSNDPTLPPMGLRVRLRRSFSLRGFPRQARIVLTALKRYGMILADNGSPWFISGSPSPLWSNDELHTLDRVHGRDLEVVDTGPGS